GPARPEHGCGLAQKEGVRAQNQGQIFMDCPAQSKIFGDAKKLYEEAAFAAMLETIKRKEEAAQAAHAH
ncbi:hypothetical protein THAOC_03853, partial [Thalassiosira oceanica]